MVKGRRVFALVFLDDSCSQVDADFLCGVRHYDMSSYYGGPSGYASKAYFEYDCSGLFPLHPG